MDVKKIGCRACANKANVPISSRSRRDMLHHVTKVSNPVSCARTSDKEWFTYSTRPPNYLCRERFHYCDHEHLDYLLNSSKPAPPPPPAVGCWEKSVQLLCQVCRTEMCQQGQTTLKGGKEWKGRMLRQPWWLHHVTPRGKPQRTVLTGLIRNRKFKASKKTFHVRLWNSCKQAF